MPDSVELIDGFNGCMPFSEVRFPPLGRLRKITGFQGCGSLREVEIPRSVALIVNGFWNCQGLRKVTFAAGGLLQSLGGFKDCPLKEIVIPAGGRGRALRLNPRVYIAFEEEASIAELRRNSQMRTSGAGIV
jgi:hypothetical protein